MIQRLKDRGITDPSQMQQMFQRGGQRPAGTGGGQRPAGTSGAAAGRAGQTND
jgi:HlyD family secretion protein